MIPTSSIIGANNEMPVPLRVPSSTTGSSCKDKRQGYAVYPFKAPEALEKPAISGNRLLAFSVAAKQPSASNICILTHWLLDSSYSEGQGPLLQAGAQ